MPKRKVLFGVVAMLLVILAGMIIWHSTSSEGVVQPEASEMPFTEKNAQYLESALNSQDEENQAKALIPSHRKDTLPGAKALKGATIRIDRKSFDVNGKTNECGTYQEDLACVQATAKAGKTEKKFILHLEFIENQWLVYATELKG